MSRTAGLFVPLLFMAGSMAVGCNCGAGTDVSGSLLATPAFVDFGPVTPHSIHQQDVTLRNVGPGAVEILDTRIDGDARQAFRVSVQSIRIGVDEETVARVVYTPEAVGQDRAQVLLKLKNSGRTLSLSLSGDAMFIEQQEPDGGLVRNDAGTSDAGTPDVDAGQAFYCGDAGIDFQAAPWWQLQVTDGGMIGWWWEDGVNGGTVLVVARADDDGLPVPDSKQVVSPDDGTFFSEAVLGTNGEQVVALYTARSSLGNPAHLRFVRLNANLSPIPGSDIALSFNMSDERTPGIAWNPNRREWGVIWNNVEQVGNGLLTRVLFARISEQGVLQTAMPIELLPWTNSVAVNSGGERLVFAGDRYAFIAAGETTPLSLYEMDEEGGLLSGTPTVLPVLNYGQLALASIAWNGSEYGYSGEDHDGYVCNNHCAYVFGRVQKGGGLVPDSGIDLYRRGAAGNGSTESLIWTGQRWMVLWSHQDGELLLPDIWFSSVSAEGELECTRQITNSGRNRRGSLVYQGGRARIASMGGGGDQEFRSLH